MAQPSDFPIHVRTLEGLEPLLVAELTALGATALESRRRFVACQGNRELLYRINLWSRVAIRTLLPIHEFPADSDEQLYAGVREVAWADYLDASDTLWIDPLVHSSYCTHSQYAAQRMKDAICDQFRERTGERPSVDRDQPRLRLSLYLYQNHATLYRDASGESLHKRGWRRQSTEASLNEALAAGLVMLAGWTGQTPLVDPMCGSGTLVIEAAMLARNMAPGLSRRGFGFQGWPDYEPTLFKRLVDEAATAERPRVPVPILACDQDPKVLKIARQHAAAAGVADDIDFAVRDFLTAGPITLPPRDLPEAPAADQGAEPNAETGTEPWLEQPADGQTVGTLLFNPPYGERLKVADLEAFYQQIGDTLKHGYPGWTAWVFTGNLEAAKVIGLKPARRIPLRNGPLDCRLLRFDLHASTGTTPTWRAVAEEERNKRVASESHSREMFAARLRKMARHFGKWARRQGITCYRVYDRDVPEIPLAIDRYNDHVHVSEFDRPHDRNDAEQDQWADALHATIAATLEVPANQVHWKHRQRQRGTAQYERQADDHCILRVQEAGLSFRVNLSDYLDTGLFLDHRQTRAKVREWAADKRVLNLFAYTGSFTVYAAAGGASQTSTVDLSNTYLDWTRDNLRLNNLLTPAQRLVRADAFDFLAGYDGPPFDLVVVDPPTFSNSKKMEGTLDIQRDHVALLHAVARVTALGGTIVFSTNRKKFRLEEAELLAGAAGLPSTRLDAAGKPVDGQEPWLAIREITNQTVPPDFAQKRPHRCWQIRRGR